MVVEVRQNGEIVQEEVSVPELGHGNDMSVSVIKEYTRVNHVMSSVAEG